MYYLKKMNIDLFQLLLESTYAHSGMKIILKLKYPL